jgi:tetratricopeptide (TPR) repeat protein
MSIIEQSNLLVDNEKSYLFNLGTTRMLLGDFKNAMACYQYLLVNEPNNALYTKSLASCFQQMTKFDLAYLYYQLSLALNNSDIKCMFYSAVCLFNLANYTKAAQLFLDFIQLSDNDELKLRSQVYLEQISLKNQDDE